MRLSLLLAFWATLLTLVFASNWDKEDYEIFDLVSAVEKFEGRGVTFYSWLGVGDKASNAEITKAYKKKSLELHPDKNGGTKAATERYARLTTVGAILRGPQRDRYDFWKKNGVPKWRGTGYYFSRYRPGIGTVLIFLAVLTSFLQNVVHRLNYKREVERVQRFMLLARKAAWGPKLVKNDAPRKVRVNIAGNPYIDGEEQEYVQGRTIEMLVQGNEVYLIEGGSKHILNEGVPEKPSWKRTWPVVLGGWVLRFVSGGEKASSEAETQGGEGYKGYEVEDTNATATEVDEANSGVGKAGGAGKRRRVKGRW